VLLVTLSSPTLIEVGRLGSISFDAGIYAYVGSAFGPGGLAARLGRYIAGPVRKHWHIDHLLEHGEVAGALVSTNTSRLECTWATWLGTRCSGHTRGFGASDCSCHSHLFFIHSQKQLKEIIRAIGCDLQVDL
jgi:Uri superfamily endonuclease